MLRLPAASMLLAALLLSVGLLAAEDTAEDSGPAEPQPIAIRVIEVGDIVQVFRAADPEHKESVVETLDRIAYLIQESIAVDMWEDNGGRGSIKPVPPGSLAIAQTETMHGQVQEFLRDLRQPMRTNILLETRVVCADPGEVEGLIGKQASHAILTAPEAEKLLSRAGKWVIASPRARIVSGSATTFRLGNTRRYTSGYSASTGDTGAVVYRPVLSEMHDGLTVWTEAASTPERDQIVLTIRPCLQVVRKMDKSLWAEANRAPALSVEEPLGSKTELDAICSVADGSAVIVGPLLVPKGADVAVGSETLREGRELHVIVTARIIGDESGADRRSAE